MIEDLAPEQKRQRLKELAIVFLKLGAIAFGGPVAHIAMMDEEIVQRRGWLSREKLLDLLGITYLIPGPNSTELAIHIGYERAGLQGLLVAGSCFILPALVIVWMLAIVYVQFQSLPQLDWLLYGIKPVIIAIMIQATWKLGRSAIRDTPTAIAAFAVVIAFFLKGNELLLLLLAGLGVMLFKTLWPRTGTGAAIFLPFSGFVAQANPLPVTTQQITGVKVFLFFLKVGSVLYGSGYVLLAFLQRDLVERYQWLTSQQLLDAIAVGQVTPGPVFTTATFIGYLLAGHGGAIAGTLGIFLPAFILVALVNPWVSWLRTSPWASGFLDGVNAASLGLMAVVTYTLGQDTLVDWLSVGLAVASAIALFRFKFNSAWLVLAGGLIGILSQSIPAIHSTLFIFYGLLAK